MPTKNIHQQIKELIESGALVYSFALGRVGQIISVDDHPSGYVVNIHNRVARFSGATRFDEGDPVKLVQVEPDRNGRQIYKVINELN